MLVQPNEYIMKNVITIFALSFIAFNSVSCREEKETVVVKEVQVENTSSDREGILERTAKKVDNEVNKEIDQKIETIGDDN
ncbi:hypothetical protein DSM00_2293 [Leeuwenhoekiella aequorea]|uniref:Uncharacterized protein n=2 Tax=Leeuwenhoekiella aequorea TaxID=283736 RepID=A0A4Q0P5V6_9FLAO|nr:hypothetical protein DSM00_2293 [Leeuwenhoekiella aequorea]